jgi:hypothetical protein
MQKLGGQIVPTSPKINVGITATHTVLRTTPTCWTLFNGIVNTFNQHKFLIQPLLHRVISQDLNIHAAHVHLSHPS